MVHGQRLLLDVLDDKWKHSPTQVWLQFFKDAQSLRRGAVTSIDFVTLKNAVNQLAGLLYDDLRDKENKSADGKRVLCYVGPSDARYFIFALAAATCGWQALFSSPRNNVEGHFSLLRSTGCRTLLTPIDGFNHGIPGQALADEGIHCSTIPALDDLLSHKDSFDDFSPSSIKKTFTNGAEETFMYLHTSGSTGEPKPVAITNGLIATIDAQQALPPVDDRFVTAHEWKDKAVYVSLPPFHSAGINVFAYSIFQNTQLILGPPDMTPSTTVLRQILDCDIAQAGILAPSILADAAKEDDLLKKLEAWSSVGFGGAPLAQSVGDKIWEHTKIVQLLGSTETNNIPELPAETKDEWPYHHFHPGLGIEWRPHADGLYELVLIRSESIRQHQGAFWTFSDLQEYSMRDLYEPHPTKPGLWAYKGRVDDIIVLENGEKFNPKAAETLIAGHAGIDSALIVGSGRMQAALLVEASGEQDFWEVVQRANKSLPKHAQIDREHLRVVPPGSFAKSAKGEIRRGVTEKALRDTIDEVYRSAAEKFGSMDDAKIDFGSRTSLLQSLQRLLRDDFSLSTDISETSSVFDLGLDSLQISRLARKLKSAVQACNPEAAAQISTRMIYDCGSLTHLADNLLSLVAPSKDSSSSMRKSSSTMTIAANDDMQRTLDHFCSRIDDLPLPPRRKRLVRKQRSPATILLTGSTGSLGSHVLRTITRRKDVARIICLNRPNSKRSAPPPPTGSIPIETVEADLSDPKSLSLLSDTITHIIHIAWPVNFTYPLSYFQSQLEACYNLISFAGKAPKRPKITFISSVGAANDYDGEVPEKILHDFSASESMGYAQSKQIAEIMFDHAAEVLSLDVDVCRVGQIAAPITASEKSAHWNASEWFPRLLKSSKQVGMLPSSLGGMDRMDWIPVDLLSDIVVDSAFSSPNRLRWPFRGGSCFSRRKSARVLHFVNPHTTLWSSIAPAVLQRCNSGSTKLVEYDEWLKAALQRETPAAALQDFFQDLGKAGSGRPIFSTTKTQRCCPRLRKLDAVNVEWMMRWIKQLEEVGEL